MREWFFRKKQLVYVGIMLAGVPARIIGQFYLDPSQKLLDFLLLWWFFTFPAAAGLGFIIDILKNQGVIELSGQESDKTLVGLIVFISFVLAVIVRI